MTAKPFVEITVNDMKTPRYARMRRFADGVERILDDFLPRDVRCRREVRRRLCEVGWKANFELLQVPDEADALDAAALVKALLESKMPPLFADATSPAIPAVDAILRRWSKEELGDGLFRYSGQIFADAKKRFYDGAFIRTSAVRMFPDATGVIRTLNSTYRLEPYP